MDVSINILENNLSLTNVVLAMWNEIGSFDQVVEKKWNFEETRSLPRKKKNPFW